MSDNGKLIMFDGPDGVGKTTQFELAKEELQKRGLEVFATHLLGGTDIGEALRGVLFSDAPRPAITNFHTSLAIYYALVDKVTSERAKGKIVLIDRSPLSLVAYQVYGDNFDKEKGFAACNEALNSFKPDLLIVYQAPFETLQVRRKRQQQSKPSDYFEGQQLAYHQRTTQGYQDAAVHYDATIIDASGQVEAIHATTMQMLDHLFTLS